MPPTNNLSRIDHQAQPPGKSLHARISHGDLKYASYPVMVGHYQGDGIVSAEAVLDQALDFRLSQAHQLGLYPESLSEAEVFLHPDENTCLHCKGAIVIGLGRVGELNSAKLQATVEHGIISYVHALVERGANYPAQIVTTFLLVGSGPGGMLIEDSINAILRGVIKANQALILCYPNTAQIDNIEFIELYLDRAIQAARALQVSQENEEFEKLLRIDPLIHSLEGGLQRVVYSVYEQLDWWQRVQIVLQDNGALCFTSLVKRARAEDTVLQTQRTVIDNLLKHSTVTTRRKNELAVTLFELLVPIEFKHHIHNQGDTLLILDSSSATYPWELLQQKNMHPVSVRCGLIRQLRQNVFRYSPIHADGRDILVIGDPLLDVQQQINFKPLQAACDEAFTVNKILESHNFSVTLLIRENAQTILQALFTKPYRILHLAGHGVFQFTDENIDQSISGMVLSENIFLTPNEIAQMQTVPELVFINCCYLGRIEDDEYYQSTNDLQPHLLAANLAQQFIKNGVRCVIAAGWEVDDEAGKHFAEVFYQQLVNHQIPFGEAVRKARESVYHRFKEYNTWGAYQCYGDPGYRLMMNFSTERETALVSHSKKEPKYSSIQELLSDLNNQTVPFPEVIKLIPKQWLNHGELLCELGRTYGLNKKYREALDLYQRGHTAETAQIRFETIYQFAELAVEWAMTATVTTKPLSEEQLQALSSAINKLKSLIIISATGQHYAQLGKVYRCLAMFSSSKARIQAINNMHQSYKKACNLFMLSNKEPEIEWVSQWMAAALIKNWRSRDNLLDVPAKLTKQIKTRIAQPAIQTAKMKMFFKILEYDLVHYLAINSDVAESSQNKTLSFLRLENYQQTEHYYGPGQVKAKLLPTIDFLLKMSRHRRTKSAAYAHKTLQSLKQALFDQG